MVRFSEEDDVPERIEQWDIFELVLHGPSSNNPFVDIDLSATFRCQDRQINVSGFYDGQGVYRVRFMPVSQGEWTYITHSNHPSLTGKSGSFTCIAPTGNNHGPVRVAHTFHFAYSDGTPYRQIGTTAYAWTHQGEELESQTLETLRHSPFNKIRMCVFPKNYAFNSNEPPLYPFEGTPPNQWDTTRFNPRFFQHFEKRVGQLRDLGIEADIILFHPYDKGRWGFDRMDEASDDRYLKYVIARLSAYRNVWWSLANEFDFMTTKTPADWERYARIVVESDPYGHLRSIHNGRLIYDHNQKWVTHASIQNGSAVEDFGRAVLYRDVYRKPCVFDEVKYEGNIPQRWGNLTAEEMVHRFWQGTIAGTYVGHGETYLHPQDIIWWARGGQLYGQSPSRIAFLRKILEEGPKEGLEPIDKWQDVYTVGQPGQYYLIYFGKERRTEWNFDLPQVGLNAKMRFFVDVIDTWNMTIEALPHSYVMREPDTYRAVADGPVVRLPGRPWIALRIRRDPNDGIVYRDLNKIVYGEG
jgi:hypothetical protein